MKWIKKGNIFNKHHAQVPVVDSSEIDYWRIYYSTRDEKNRSRAMYIDVEPGNPSHILNECDKPKEIDYINTRYERVIYIKPSYNSLTEEEINKFLDEEEKRHENYLK